jgi:hypothetical protein
LQLTFSLGKKKLSMGLPGTHVMIFKEYSPKKLAKNGRFLIQNKAKICKN